MSILEEFYRGNIHSDDCHKVRNPEYWRLNKKIGEEKENWLKPLLGENYKRFDELDNMFHQRFSIEQMNAFTYGFRLASRIMIDVLSKDLYGDTN
jgi:hypothetical protein